MYPPLLVYPECFYAYPTCSGSWSQPAFLMNVNELTLKSPKSASVAAPKNLSVLRSNGKWNRSLVLRVRLSASSRCAEALPGSAGSRSAENLPNPGSSDAPGSMAPAPRRRSNLCEKLQTHEITQQQAGFSPPPISGIRVDQYRSGTQEMGKASLENLGKEITLLVEMLEDGKRRSIHQPMRDVIESIRTLYERLVAQKDEQGGKEAPKTHQASQTSPLFRPVAEPRRKGVGPNPPSTKRSRREPSHAATQTRAGTGQPGQPTEPDPGTQRTKDAPKWKLVGPKKGKNQRRPNPEPKEKPKPDALVIMAKGEASYADILRRVKQDKKLQALGEAVTRIRRTQKGELLLQLKKSGEDTAGYRALVTESIGDEVEVRSLSHKIEIECRDLDEITTREEVAEAIGKLVETPGLPETDILLRKSFGQTQTAIIRMPAGSGRKVLDIGWVKVSGVRAHGETMPERYRSLTHVPEMRQGRAYGQKLRGGTQMRVLHQRWEGRGTRGWKWKVPDI
ncbi:uncharacterized protein Dana_GF20516 [Drosophila ananassae]|uniref:Gag-like protein n=1 Tax=Drosophila ananassae TaxID=7217 RepID=B3MPY2_DROAN|nr:uncharacterized protein Dana_GF20516 [Drosophila ananassae]